MKSENRRTEQVLGWGFGTGGRGEWQSKGQEDEYGKQCIHIYVNEKWYLLKLFQESGRGVYGRPMEGRIQL
jgi:hypothetical protein